MERTDILRMADSVLREYGVPLKVAGISHAGADWTIAFAGTFPGAHAIEDALQAGVDTTGVTIHYVDEGLDTGAVICQEPVPVEPRRTLIERIHAVEHRLLPEVVQQLCAR